MKNGAFVQLAVAFALGRRSGRRDTECRADLRRDRAAFCRDHQFCQMQACRVVERVIVLEVFGAERRHRHECVDTSGDAVPVHEAAWWRDVSFGLRRRLAGEPRDLVAQRSRREKVVVIAGRCIDAAVRAPGRCVAEIVASERAHERVVRLGGDPCVERGRTMAGTFAVGRAQQPAETGRRRHRQCRFRVVARRLCRHDNRAGPGDFGIGVRREPPADRLAPLRVPLVVVFELGFAYVARRDGARIRVERRRARSQHEPWQHESHRNPPSATRR
ncbi:hypothetical protein [Tahibacter soli]|uniref:Uncharacterized protein n=1 Tax=Tahibacter soli TaxID=2983605 RepID=A0A9X3YJK2_9GAMM|nr:hypothetical protein [Tahibacter soli]MDC8013462.1 hypothetical protein [Tahibacter soli]